MAEVPANLERIEAEAEAIRLLLSSEVWSSEAAGTTFPHGNRIAFAEKDGVHHWEVTLLCDKVLQPDRPFATQKHAKQDAAQHLREYLVALTERWLPPAQSS
jgi:hypothetical protein